MSSDGTFLAVHRHFNFGNFVSEGAHRILPGSLHQNRFRSVASTELVVMCIAVENKIERGSTARYSNRLVVENAAELNPRKNRNVVSEGAPSSLSRSLLRYVS